MKNLGRLALALATIAYGSAAVAQSTKEAPAGSGQRYQGVMLIDPTTGNPYSATGSGGSGSGYTGATATAPGTNGTTATPVQGVDGGKALAVTWTGALPVNNSQINGVAISTGSGASGTGTQRTILATDQPAIPVNASQPSGAVYAVSWTGQTVGVTGTVTAAQGAPAAIANAWPTYLTQGGAALSSTNGLPTTDTNAAQSFTAPGTSAAKAQGVQFVTGGIPFGISGSVYGFDAAGATPTKAPIAIAYIDATGKVQYASTTTMLPVAASEADGANVTIGAKADAASAAASASLMARVFQLHTDLIAPTPAGTAIIGKVGIDQTTPGTTNGVVNSPSTGASLTTSQPSITTTAAALTFAGTVRRSIYNPATNTASIFIGASGVTTATGWEIPPGASEDVSRFSGSVFAIAASAQTVRLISY